MIAEWLGLAEVKIFTLQTRPRARQFPSRDHSRLKLECQEMKKSSAQIRAEMARLKDQLVLAETREAERIGRLAVKAGLGEIEVGDDELEVAFADLAARFRGRGSTPTGEGEGEGSSPTRSTTAITPRSTTNGVEEA